MSISAKDIPPAPDFRHPLSNPKETLRKEGDQCQGCYKNKDPGQRFFWCSGCKLAKYCSPECQKRDWPTHKAKCKYTQLASTAPPDPDAQCLSALRKFTDIYRVMLGEFGLSALRLRDDPSNAEHSLLMVIVHAREAARREHSFYVTTVAVLEYTDLPPRLAGELQAQRRQLDVGNRQRGQAGTFFVLLQCADPLVCNPAPFSFGSPAELSPYNPRWMEMLMTILNEGIVL